jgi:hypothetical protein
MHQDCCHADHAYCRSCPERCFQENEPMEAKEPTFFDRLSYGLSQWVSRTLLPAVRKGFKSLLGEKR